MKKARKIVLVVGVICFAVFFLLQLADLFSPGSYPYAEKYELNVNEKTWIAAANSFKIEDSSYNVPQKVGLRDGRRDSSDYWYHIYFYYREENQIVKTWVRSSGSNRVTFAFVAINDGLSLGRWREINKDFSQSENREQLRKFEEQILSEIEEKVSN